MPRILCINDTPDVWLKAVEGIDESHEVPLKKRLLFVKVDEFALDEGAVEEHERDLDELVETEAAYEALILDLARSPQQLQTVTEKLAQNRRTSPLFDAGLLTNHLETGYRAAYQRWVEQKPPAHIRIAP